MEDKQAEQTPDLRWFSRVVRSLKEGHGVRVHPSLVWFGQRWGGGGSKVTVTREQQHVGNTNRQAGDGAILDGVPQPGPSKTAEQNQFKTLIGPGRRAAVPEGGPTEGTASGGSSFTTKQPRKQAAKAARERAGRRRGGEGGR